MLFRGILVALIALALAFPTGMGLVGQHARSQVRVVAWNEGSQPQTIRVTDSLTGLAVAVGQVEPGRRSVVFEGRLEPWWVSEDPDGERRKVVIETLSSGCDLLGRTTALERVEELFIDPDGSLAHTSWQAGDPALADRSIAAPVEDPCAGRPAVPRGLVINRTMVTVQVHAGLVLEPCSKRTIRPGDLVP